MATLKAIANCSSNSLEIQLTANWQYCYQERQFDIVGDLEKGPLTIELRELTVDSRIWAEIEFPEAKFKGRGIHSQNPKHTQYEIRSVFWE